MDDLISEKSAERLDDGRNSDVMNHPLDASSDLGHFERQAEVRFHPTESEKAGGIHVAAEKAREAQQKLEENLKESADAKDEPKWNIQMCTSH